MHIFRGHLSQTIYKLHIISVAGGRFIQQKVWSLMICFHLGSVLFVKSTPYKALTLLHHTVAHIRLLNNSTSKQTFFSGGRGEGKRGMQLVLRRFPLIPTQLHPARFCSYIHIDKGQFHSYNIIKPIVVFSYNYNMTSRLGVK